MIPLITIFIFCSHLPAFAAFESEYVSARLMGMGKAYVAVCDDANSALSNPAGLDCLYGMSLSSGYTKYFGMDELTKAQIIYSIATNFGGLSVDISDFGDALYSEKIVGISYGKQAIDKIYMGFKLKWYNLEIGESYGNKSIYSFDIGLLGIANKNMRIGAFAENISNHKITRDKTDNVSSGLTIGVAYLVNRLTFAFDVYKEPSFQKEYRMGIEYQLINPLAIRFGTRTEPSQYSAGITIRYSLFNFDYAYVHHTVLGGTHYFSITMNWANK